eukprot:CFRG1352T1
MMDQRTAEIHRSLSSKKAFEALMREIGDIVDEKRPSHHFLALLRRYLLGSFRQMDSGLEPGLSHVLVIVCGVVLIIVGQVTKDWEDMYRSNAVIGEGCVLVIVGCFNLFLCVREAYAQDVELMDRLSDLSAQYLDILHSHGEQKAWPYQSVDPTCNSSPPITLVHVYRDGVLGHMPANLLVEGDLVQMAVGHVAPANLRCVEIANQSIKYKRGETIQALPTEVDVEDDDLACPYQTRQRFVVEETPIVTDILHFLERRAKRPVPILVVKLQYVCRCMQMGLAVVFLLIEIINICRYLLVSEHAGVWSEMLIVFPLYTVLPILPLCLPFFWFMMNAFGVAHILATYDMLLETDYAPKSGRRHSDFGQSAPQDNDLAYEDRWDDGDGISADSSFDGDVEARHAHQSQYSSTFPTIQRGEIPYVPHLYQVWRRVFQVWYGSAHATLPRSSSLFLTLGSITVVCTVDKEGVLSYPTPSVEKVFLSASKQVDLESNEIHNNRESTYTDIDTPASINSPSTIPDTTSTGVDTGICAPANMRVKKSFSFNAGRNSPQSLKLGSMPTRYSTNDDTCGAFKNSKHSVSDRDTASTPSRLKLSCTSLGLDEEYRNVPSVTESMVPQSNETPNNVQGRGIEHSKLCKSCSSFCPSVEKLVDLGMKSGTETDGRGTEIVLKRTMQTMHSFTLDGRKAHRSRIRKQSDMETTTVSVIVPHTHEHASPCSMSSARPRCLSVDAVTPVDNNVHSHTTARPHDVQEQDLLGAMLQVNDHEYVSQTDGEESEDGEVTDATTCPNTNTTIRPVVERGIVIEPSLHGDRSVTIENVTGTMLDPVVMEMTHDKRLKYGFKFFDSDWEVRLPLLKPLGLNVLLNTNCHRPWLSMRHADQMRYITYVKLNKVLTSRKRCLCLLAKTIGFADSSLQPFRRRQQIWAFAKEATHSAEIGPRHTSAIMETQDDRDRGEPVPSMISQLVEDTGSGRFHLLSEGSVPLVLETCTDWWDGKNVVRMSDADRRRIMEFYKTMSTRMLVIAFCYRPIHRSHDWFNHNNPVSIAYSSKVKSPSHPFPRTRTGMTTPAEIRYKCRQMVQHQVFTGMVAVQRQARETVVKVVSQLDNAGIRFVFFSQQDAGSSTAFAETLGLPTGWNTHISLNENATDVTAEGPSQLPRGIQSIRPHLENVDDVPLLVQLFTDCTVDATGEMISIMQEHGEVVCCIGSSLRTRNMILFSQADISIGIEPLAPKNCLNVDSSRNFMGTPKTPGLGTAGERTNPSADVANTALNTLQSMMATVRFYQEADVPVLALSAELTNIGCSLAIGKQTNLHVIMHLIATARHCLHNAHNCLFFILGLSLSLSLLMLFNAILVLPPVLTGVDILWLTLVLFPFQAIPLWASRVGKVMHLMPDKNTRQVKDVPRFVVNGLLRFGPSVVVVMAVFICCLYGMCESVLVSGGLAPSCSYYGPTRVTNGRTWTNWSVPYAMGLRTAQKICCSLIAVSIVPLSSTFMHRTIPVWNCQMHRQYLWMSISTLTILFQIIYVTLSQLVEVSSTPSFGFSDIPWYAYFIAILWLPIVVIVSEFSKSIYSNRFTLLQKRARLLFDTKLGMHSPV